MDSNPKQHNYLCDLQMSVPSLGVKLFPLIVRLHSAVRNRPKVPNVGIVLKIYSTIQKHNELILLSLLCDFLTS